MTGCARRLMSRTVPSAVRTRHPLVPAGSTWRRQMSRRRSLWSVPAAILAATTFAGAPTLAQDDPEKLVIGFVPSVEAGALVEDIEPLAGYLTEALGIPVEGFVSSDYAALVTAMETDQAQIAALPPYGLVQAVDRA